MKPFSKPPKQLSFASYEFAQKKRVTRREKFLAEMEQVVPWGRFEALIEPKYPSAGRVGRQPVGVARMLRMYFLQQWFSLSDEAVEDAAALVIRGSSRRSSTKLWLSCNIPYINSAYCIREHIMDSEIAAFFSDSHLVHLIEQLKTSNDMLDVIELTENQHSGMLAWCLNPNEGHGQGDAVIKDFLTAAYLRCELSKFDNKRFFSTWTPGRIRTTSFGSAFVTREFGIDRGEGRKGRLDLFLVDPINRLVVVIENKCKAYLDPEQLSAYHAAVKEQIGQRPVFREYDMAFIVLDKGLESYDETFLNDLSNKWTYLDYSWLQSSGERAQLQLERGNHAAQLLVSYCQKQTQWESGGDRRLSELSAALAINHELIIKKLKEVSGKELQEWTTGGLTGPMGELLLFSRQHPELCSLLISSQGIAGVRTRVQRALSHLNNEHFITGRTWFCVSSPEIAKLSEKEDDAFPAVSVNVYRESGISEESSRYAVRLLWYQNCFDGSVDAEALREHFQLRFPALRKFNTSESRSVFVGQELTANRAVDAAVALAQQIDGLIQSWSR